MNAEGCSTLEEGSTIQDDDEQQRLLALRKDESSTSVTVYSHTAPGKRAKQASTRKWKWKELITAATLWLGYLSVNAAYSVIGPFFPNEAVEKGTGSFLVGVIVSCAPLCVVLFSPLIGYYLPKLGLRFTLLSGLFLVGGAFMLLGFVYLMSSGLEFILFCVVLRMVQGIGSALFGTAAFALIPELYPDSIGTIIGLFEVAAGLGYAIGPPVGGILYKYGGFKTPFILVGGTCIVFVIPSFFLVTYTKCSTQKLSLSAIYKVFSNLVMFSLVLANTLIVAAFAFFNPTMQPFLSQQFDSDEETIALVFFVPAVAYLVCALIAGRLADKLGPRYLIIIGFAIVAVGFFFIGPADFISAPRFWITVVAYGVIGIGAALGLVPVYTDMLTTARSMHKYEEEDSLALTGVISGVDSSTLSLGEFLGPLIAGALTQIMDFQTSAVVYGEVLFAQVLLLLGVTVITKLTAS